MARQKTQSNSKALIEDLRAQGYSYNKIAKSLGRDVSLVSQIAKGKKPGANLEAGLKSLKELGEIREKPSRRVTKSGAEAQVRKARPKPQPTKPTKPIEAILDKKGRPTNVKMDELTKAEARAVIKKVREEGGVISFTAKAHGYKKYRQLKPGDVDVLLFEDGLDADDFRISGDGLEAKLIEYLLEEQDVQSVRSLSDIQMNAFY